MTDSVEAVTANRSPAEAAGPWRRWPGSAVVLAVVVAVGWGACIAYGAQFPGNQFLAVVGTTISVSAAAAAAGGLLGFLFGIPKTLQSDAGPGTGGASYQINTNLEQISDWLTKILVGVGLTQIRQIGEAAGNVVDVVAAAFGPDAAAGRAVAAGTMLYFLVAGFLGGYVWTRTVLARTFIRFDAEVVRRLDRTEAKADKAEARADEAVELSSQAARDIAALTAVDDVLRAGTAGPTGNQEALNDVVRNASPVVRHQIYSRVSGFRASTWRVDPDRMARVIPVLRALARSDTDGQYFVYLGDLGFALKDCRPPQWEEARAVLDRAIEMRDGQGIEGYWWYEFNRALCRIALDPTAGTQDPTPEPLRSEILADLRRAERNARISNLKLIARDCGPWLERNGISDFTRR